VKEANLRLVWIRQYNRAHGRPLDAPVPEDVLSPWIGTRPAAGVERPSPDPVVATTSAPIARERNRMNKGEARYAQHLDARIVAGELLWYRFEGVKLRLADDSFYSPDFLVVTATRELELHEVKGRKGESFYAEEDARLKLRFAAESYPFRVIVVWPLTRPPGAWGQWQV